MPQYTVKAVQKRDQWSSGHGEFQTYAVQLSDYNGWVVLNQKVTTPAPNVGDVLEGYIAPDNRGNPKFNKQKEGYGQGPQSQGSGQTSSGGRSNYVPKDEAAIKAMWAIGQAVELATALSPGKPVKLEDVENAAIELFAMVETVKTATEPLPAQEESSDVVLTDIDERGVTLDDIPF